MLKRYLKDNSGQFAVMFSVAATMLLLAVSAAIDVMGAQKHKRDLQAMTDVAVLAAAKLKTDKLIDLKAAANAAISGNSQFSDAVNITVSVSGDTISIEGESLYNTQLMGMIGVPTMEVRTVSEAPIPRDVPVNIALVLDSTASMSGANMDALKSASKKLLATFADSAPGTVQAGVVPYNRYVNVGMSNRNRPWMDVPDDSTTTYPEYCYMRKDLISQDCSSTSYQDTCYNDSGAYSCTKTSTTCTNQVYGPEYEYCYTPTSSSTWYGCAGSRLDPDHKDPDYKGSPVPGKMNVTCGTELLDLTTNMVDVEAKIDSLTASGNTYIPAGLIWGWRMLDPDQPLGGLTNSQTDRKRALILMTDGANTVRKNGTNHDNDTQQTYVNDTNALTAELCTLIKDEGIDLYSVAYKLGSGDPVAEQMIADCASTPGHFFSAENQDELEKAFEDIKLSLFEVRLSR